jgi:hypothetical protein
MPSLKPERIRGEFQTQPNGDVGFTFKVIARKSGIEINGDLVGPREQGWRLQPSTSAAAWPSCASTT